MISLLYQPSVEENQSSTQNKYALVFKGIRGELEFIFHHSIPNMVYFTASSVDTKSNFYVPHYNLKAFLEALEYRCDYMFSQRERMYFDTREDDVVLVFQQTLVNTWINNVTLNDSMIDDIVKTVREYHTKLHDAC